MVVCLAIFPRRTIAFWINWCATLIAIFVFFPHGIVKLGPDNRANPKSELKIERSIAADVKAFQTELPYVLDETMTVNMVVSKGKTIEFYYEAGFSSVDLDSILQDLREGILVAACKNPQHYLNTIDGFLSLYAFSPNDSEEYIFRISIQQSDCNF